MNIMEHESFPIANPRQGSWDDSFKKHDERRVAISFDTKQMMTPALISSLNVDEPGLLKKQRKDILSASPNNIASRKEPEIKKDFPPNKCKSNQGKGETLMGKDTWLFAFLEMKRKQERKSCLTDADISNEERNNINYMIQTYKAPKLRQKLYMLQRQLYCYHDYADKVEELKEQNRQLADKVSQLEREDIKEKSALKKHVQRKLRALKGEIEQLNSDLAQSRSKADRHEEEMSKIYQQKSCLEEQMRALRLERDAVKNAGNSDDTSQRNIGAISRLRDQLLTSFSARSLAVVSTCSEDDNNLHDSCPISFNASELDQSVNLFRDDKLLRSS